MPTRDVRLVEDTSGPTAIILLDKVRTVPTTHGVQGVFVRVKIVGRSLRRKGSQVRAIDTMWDLSQRTLWCRIITFKYTSLAPETFVGVL